MVSSGGLAEYCLRHGMFWFARKCRFELVIIVFVEIDDLAKTRQSVLSC